jgi:tetratricopeptide (TPR) repeat protein
VKAVLVLLLGFTRYWTWQGQPDETRVRAAVAEMKRVAEAHPDLVRVEATEDSITINGLGEGEHEDFVFPGRPGFNFVKTDGKPYDAVVRQCLGVARRYFGGQIAIHSDDETEIDPSMTSRFAPYGRWSGLLYPGAMALFFYFMFMRSRGGTNWGSYYLFWILAPLVVSLLVAHPLVLLAIPVALVARRWLPDPWLAIKHAGRIRALDADVRANPDNVTARRNLAVIYLEKRRPGRALALVDQALARDAESNELRFLRGLALLRLRRFEDAVGPLVEVCQRDPKFRYGEAYLRAADALGGLRHWEDACDALERFVEVNKSSVEGLYKLALARRAAGDAAGAQKALAEARQVYRDSPAFHRRKQFGWYLRARLK